MSYGPEVHSPICAIYAVFSRLPPFPLAGERVLSTLHGVQEGKGNGRNYPGFITRFRRLGTTHGLVDMDDSNSLDEI